MSCAGVVQTLNSSVYSGPAWCNQGNGVNELQILGATFIHCLAGVRINGTDYLFTAGPVGIDVDKDGEIDAGADAAIAVALAGGFTPALPAAVTITNIELMLYDYGQGVGVIIDYTEDGSVATMEAIAEVCDDPITMVIGDCQVETYSPSPNDLNIIVRKTEVTVGPYVVGNTVTWTITVINEGPSDATGIVVQDVIPGALTYTSDVPSQGVFVPGTGIWTVGALLRNGTATLTINTTVNDDSVNVVNTATLTGVDQNDVYAGDDSGTVTFIMGPCAAPVDACACEACGNTPTYITSFGPFQPLVQNTGSVNSDGAGLAAVTLPSGVSEQFGIIRYFDQVDWGDGTILPYPVGTVFATHTYAPNILVPFNIVANVKVDTGAGIQSATWTIYNLTTDGLGNLIQFGLNMSGPGNIGFFTDWNSDYDTDCANPTGTVENSAGLLGGVPGLYINGNVNAVPFGVPPIPHGGFETFALPTAIGVYNELIEYRDIAGNLLMDIASVTGEVRCLTGDCADLNATGFCDCANACDDHLAFVHSIGLFSPCTVQGIGVLSSDGVSHAQPELTGFQFPCVGCLPPGLPPPYTALTDKPHFVGIDWGDGFTETFPYPNPPTSCNHGHNYAANIAVPFDIVIDLRLDTDLGSSQTGTLTFHNLTTNGAAELVSNGIWTMNGIANNFNFVYWVTDADITDCNNPTVDVFNSVSNFGGVTPVIFTGDINGSGFGPIAQASSQTVPIPSTIGTYPYNIFWNDSFGNPIATITGNFDVLCEEAPCAAVACDCAGCGLSPGWFSPMHPETSCYVGGDFSFGYNDPLDLGPFTHFVAGSINAACVSTPFPLSPIPPNPALLYVNWGDGSPLDFGPFLGPLGERATHTYAPNLLVPFNVVGVVRGTSLSGEIIDFTVTIFNVTTDFLGRPILNGRTLDTLGLGEDFRWMATGAQNFTVCAAPTLTVTHTTGFWLGGGGAIAYQGTIDVAPFGPLAPAGTALVPLPTALGPYPSQGQWLDGAVLLVQHDETSEIVCE